MILKPEEDNRSDLIELLCSCIWKSNTYEEPCSVH